MGFSLNANKAITNNRALQKSVSSNYLKRKSTYKKHNYHAYYTEDTKHISLSRIEKQKIICIIFSIIASGVLIVTLCNKPVPPSVSPPPSLTEVNPVVANSKYYHRTINTGNKRLSEGNVELAMSQFIEGLTIYPNGKKGLIGLTKSMLIMCKNENKYCLEA